MPSSIHRHSLLALPLRVVPPAKCSRVFTLSDAPLDLERGAARQLDLSSLFPSRRLRETILPNLPTNSNLRMPGVLRV
jgi:hypothetical protein